MKPEMESFRSSEKMTDDEIMRLSEKFGCDQLQLSIFLNYDMWQYEIIRNSYNGIVDQTFKMVRAWHDVVVQCGENPRQLLKSVLCEIGNRYLAETFFREVSTSQHECKAETIQKIKAIRFETPRKVLVVNYGAPNAINIFR